jgi:hypothetical protein
VQFALCPVCLVLCVVLYHTIESSLAKCGFEKSRVRGAELKDKARQDSNPDPNPLTLPVTPNPKLNPNPYPNCNPLTLSS